MKYGIPDCWDPAEQEAGQDRVYAKSLMRRPKCQGCGCPIAGETYLDLDAFGIRGMACDRCVDAHTNYTDNLEDDYE